MDRLCFLMFACYLKLRMSEKYYSVSVVIRTRDVEGHLYKLLWRLSLQTLRPSELVVVNNFSSKSKLDEMVNLLLLAEKKFLSDRIYVKLVPITDKFSQAYSTNV